MMDTTFPEMLLWRSGEKRRVLPREPLRERVPPLSRIEGARAQRGHTFYGLFRCNFFFRENRIRPGMRLNGQHHSYQKTEQGYQL